MVIPQLDINGLLPAGIHDCTVDEIRETFGMFQGSDTRQKLASKLQEYIGELKRAKNGLYLIINGSFVTGKEKPGDIDILLVLPKETDFKNIKDLPPFQYNAISKSFIKRHYGFDIYTCVDGKESPMIDFFRQAKGRPGLEKGILRVKL